VRPRPGLLKPRKGLRLLVSRVIRICGICKMARRYIQDVIARKQAELDTLEERSARIMGPSYHAPIRARKLELMGELEELMRGLNTGGYTGRP